MNAPKKKICDCDDPVTTFSSLNLLTNRFRRVHWHIENSTRRKSRKEGGGVQISRIPGFLLWCGSCVTFFRHMYVLTLLSVPIRMLVPSIQLPSRRFASSHSTVTLNRHEIPYSCLVGGLGRIRSHSHGNRKSAATENYDYAIVRLGASISVLFRLARSIIDMLAPQQQRRPNFAISLPLPQNLSG